MTKDNLTTNASNEAESPALLVGAVISRLFSELATKHNVKVDDLNLHISCKTLYIQKYIYLENATSNIQVLHMFKLKPDQETELTVAMENAIGLLIKKMYFRLKVAIESLRQ
jgi:hypothetical protein